MNAKEERDLAAKERDSIDAAILRGYLGHADAALAEIEDLIGQQEWPEDHPSRAGDSEAGSSLGGPDPLG